MGRSLPYDDNFEGLKSLLIQEQVFDICSKDLLMFVKERQPKKLTEVLTLADQYRDAHTDPRIRSMRDKPSHTSGAQKSSSNHSNSTNSSSSTNKPNVSKGPVPFRGNPNPTHSQSRMPMKCFHCTKLGHSSWNCPEKKGRHERGASLTEGKPAADQPRDTGSAEPCIPQGTKGDNPPAGSEGNVPRRREVIHRRGEPH